MHAEQAGAWRPGAPSCEAAAIHGEFHGEIATITVMIASARRALHAAWLSWIAWEPDIGIVGGQVADPAGLANAVERHRPRVLLLDASMFQLLDRTSVLRIQRCLSVRVLLVADVADPPTLAVVLRHRLQGLLLAASPACLCLKAIRAVSRGELWLSRELMAQALTDGAWPVHSVPPVGADDADARPTEPLTHREREVVAWLHQGCSNKEIARELGIVEDTVKKHLKSVYAKLGVRRRALVLLRASASA